MTLQNVWFTTATQGFDGNSIMRGTSAELGKQHCLSYNLYKTTKYVVSMAVVLNQTPLAPRVLV